ncbi:unnamed protein product [Staurois parvus]|uniref:Uncharacterized protein n=1 Tax=Staurois parvus TaxID=386267 RepID=A0ABN9G3Y0_9NEOB|nr:unnamed protein product [Staurois parvus]
MIRDCGHSTGDDADQEMIRTADSTGDDQRLRTQYRR